MRRFSQLVSFWMPDQYQNTFYLANASLFQTINYFACSAYETVFPELAKDLQTANSALGFKMKIHENIKRLEYCESFLNLNLPIKRKIGSFQIVRGMRAYHGTFLKDFTIGGLRFREDLSRQSVQGLSILTTCLGLDVSGAHGGLKHLRHKHCDVIKPDLYCNSEIIENIQEVLTEDVLKAVDVGGRWRGLGLR